MIEACIEAGNMEILRETIVNLSKKRSFIKQAITGMIQKCMTFVEGLDNKNESKFSLIGIIREVTEGKIFVEVERARITRLLAAIRESEGKLAEAAGLMQELQVETFGSMEKRERIEFIIEQLRLLIEIGEYSKAQIVSRKISAKAFENDSFEDLKIRYLTLMIKLSLHDQQYLECARFHHQIYQVKPEDLEQLKLASLAVILAKYNNEQVNLLNLISQDRKLEESLPLYYEMLRLFRTKELIRWSQIENLYESDLKNCYVFQMSTSPKHLADFKSRIIEHNIRVIASCYSSISLARLSQLVALDVSDAELHLCTLITERMVFAKIDRVSGLVTFSKGSLTKPEDVLNEWALKTDSLLNLMVRTNHAISKEEIESTL